MKLNEFVTPVICYAVCCGFNCQHIHTSDEKNKNKTNKTDVLYVMGVSTPTGLPSDSDSDLGSLFTKFYNNESVSKAVSIQT